LADKQKSSPRGEDDSSLALDDAGVDKDRIMRPESFPAVARYQFHTLPVRQVAAGAWCKIGVDFHRDDSPAKSHHFRNDRRKISEPRRRRNDLTLTDFESVQPAR